MPVPFSRTPVLAAVATIFVIGAVWAQAPKQDWKDLAEYNLVDSINKQTDNTKKLELLNTWKEKYPNTDFKALRLQTYLMTYQALKQFDKVVETGNEIVASDPKNLQALYVMVVSYSGLTKPTPELLAMVEKAARTLATNLDELKPAGVDQAKWDEGKPPIEVLAHTTLGSLAQQRKEYAAAEKEFVLSLKASPNAANLSYSLGTVILLQKNPDTQSAGLYHIARAASLTGPGALPEPGRSQIDKYLTTTYTSFHGSAEGLDELRKTASAQVMPPEGFKIASKAEVTAKQEEEFKKSNPMLALWLTGVKEGLTGPNGQQFFEGTVKGALLPGGANGVKKFKGKLISMTPAKAPKQLVLGIVDAAIPEVTLNLDEALTGTAPVGTELEFEGVASSFTAQPFRVVFDVEKANLVGWPTPVTSGAKKAAGGAAKKTPPVTKK